MALSAKFEIVLRRPLMRSVLSVLASLLVLSSGHPSRPLELPPSFRFLPAGLLSDDAVATIRDAVASVRSRDLVSVQYSRHGGAHRSADRPMGGVLVLPPEQRRVGIVDGMRQHLDAAAALPFPLHARLRASSLPPDLQRAIRRAVEAGHDLPDVRRSYVDFIDELSRSLRPISGVINTVMPPTVAYISADVNTALMGVLVDGLDWLDVTLVERFVHGFPIVGPIPDSGVYRPLLLHVTGAEAAERYAYFRLTAPAYNRVLARRMRYRQWAPDRTADEAVARATVKERSKALVIGPFLSVEALHDALHHMAPAGSSRALVDPRLMPRFAVPQKGTWRAIDDGKSNGANAATFMRETVTTPTFFYPAIVARAIYVASDAAGLPMYAVTVALADLASAYRTIPTSQPWFTAFAMWDPVSGRVHFYFLPGHNFGLTSAVVNFNRFPELVVVAVRALALVPAEHYYDDFIIPDSALGGDTALLSVQRTMLALGRGAPRPHGERIRSPELDPGKTQAHGFDNVVLGVVADTSAVTTDGYVSFYVHPDRVDAVLDVFRAAFRAGTMRPHEASSLRGKIFFVLSAAFAQVGRAATLPLVQRQYRDTHSSFEPGSELHHSLLFFEALLPRLPPLKVSLHPPSLPPLTVYTDASFYRRRASAHARTVLSHLSTQPSGVCPADLRDTLGGDLGAVVYDPVDGTARYAYAAPPWRALLRSWSSHHKTFIAQLETLAALSVYSTYPDLFVGRTVNHWIDNTVALSALVHGYSGKPDLAKMVNIFYLQLAGLRASVYLDYVPSKENIADLPSRRQFDVLRAELAGIPLFPGATHTLAVPDVSAWHGPISAWMDSALLRRPDLHSPA